VRTHFATAVCLAVIAATASVPVPAQDQQRRRQPGWPCAGNIDPVYVRTAEASGGVVMIFKPAEAGGAAAEVSASMRHSEVVFRAGGQLGDGTHEFDIPIDSTIESAFFFVSMQCLQSVSVVRPSSDELAADAAGVEYHRFEAARLITVPAPMPGVWRVTVVGRGLLSLVVKAKTSLTLANVAFADDAAGAKSPPARQRLAASMSGAAHVAGHIAFQLVSPMGATLETADLVLEKETDDSRTYEGEATPPATPFRLAMTGIDRQGFRFQRVQKQLLGFYRE
jgi:hypothetical protein